MDWNDVQIKVPVDFTETASAIASLVVPYGIYIEDYSDLIIEAPKIAHVDLISEELLHKDTTESIIHVYISSSENLIESISFLTHRFDDENVPYTIHSDTVKEDDWANAWKQYYHPINISQRLVVCPSWESYLPKNDNETVMVLDPGMAFGTGTHDTTKLCVQMIDKYVKNGDMILDVGCGSGILSIASVLLGAAKAVGVDIDKVAVNVANENAVMNKVEHKIKYIAGDLVSVVDGKYDIVCANIVADIIIRLSKDVKSFMQPNGIFLVSGIIDTREEDVLTALFAMNFTLKERLAANGWVALAFEV